MIDEADDRLTAWVGVVLGDVPVHLDAPVPHASAGVRLYLLGLAPSPPPRASTGPQGLQVVLRYLVTTWADDPRVAHRQLAELLFAAMAVSDWEVDPAGADTATWAAMGVAPRPSFIVQVRARKELPVRPAPPVRSFVTRFVRAVPLTGRVVGPSDQPVARAYVEFPELSLVTATDASGRFHFAAVPSEPAVKRVRVRARGAVFPVDVPPPAPGGGEVMIRITPETLED